MVNQKAKLYSKIDKLSQISRGFQGAIVLATAVRFGIFDLLDRKALSLGEVAKKLELDHRAADIFLHALAGMELLEVDQGLFRNGPLADELLVRGRTNYQGDIIAHSGRLIDRWLQLSAVLKTGKPAQGPSPVEDQESRRDFILGMSNIAGLSAEKIAAGLDLANFIRQKAVLL